MSPQKIENPIEYYLILEKLWNPLIKEETQIILIRESPDNINPP